VPDLKISQLPVASATTGAELFPVVQGGVTRQIALNNVQQVGTLTSLGVSGNLTVDTNTLFVDAVNNRVGIGTVTPASALDVIGAVRTTADGASVSLYTNTGWRHTGSGGLFIDANQGGAANTVTIRNGSGFATQLTLDGSGNLGLGVTPSAWATYKAIDLPLSGALFSRGTGDGSGLAQNAFLASGGIWTYKRSTVASYYEQVSGEHRWYTAPAGTAGNAISFTQVWSMSAAGHFLAGADNTYDIGASGATRPRDVFVGRRAVIDGITVGRGGQTTVSGNIAVGASALNSASLTGSSNIAVGGNALLNTTTGANNIAVGASAMQSNTTGSNNSAVGLSAMQNNTAGISNVAIGSFALLSNTTGSQNTVLGRFALRNATVNDSNTAVGFTALQRIAGNNNVAVGSEAGVAISRGVATFGAIVGGSGYTNGSYTNVALTLSSGSTFGDSPTANITVSGGAVTVVTLVTGGNGFQATDTVLTAAAASIGGTGSGFTVAVATLTGAVSSNNTLLGHQVAAVQTQGSDNTLLGFRAANTQTEGSGNIAIGSAVQLDSLTGSNQINIGTRYFHDRIRLLERATDPAKPAEGNMVLWMSNGAGLGDDGDVLIGSTAGGVTNYAILFDHSAGTLWP
jgi:hypothetical protein